MGDITGPSRTKSKGSKLLEPLKVGWMPPKMSTRGGMGIFTIRKGGYHFLYRLEGGGAIPDSVIHHVSSGNFLGIRESVTGFDLELIVHKNVFDKGTPASVLH
jgi:hypothetical protein